MSAAARATGGSAFKGRVRRCKKKNAPPRMTAAAAWARKAIQPSGRQAAPATRHSPAEGRAGSPHTSPAAKRASEKGSPRSMVKFKNSIPRKNAK